MLGSAGWYSYTRLVRNIAEVLYIGILRYSSR
jgi:hypothetical protein